MKVLDPGHEYELDWLDGQPGEYEDGFKPNQLIFVKREGEVYPGNVGYHPGTTLQEILRACIDRVKYLDGQIHDELNVWVLKDLRHAIMLLELRAARRHGRNLAEVVTDPYGIERLPVCSKCLHIGCSGSCHP